MNKKELVQALNGPVTKHVNALYTPRTFLSIRNTKVYKDFQISQFKKTEEYLDKKQITLLTTGNCFPSSENPLSVELKEYVIESFLSAFKSNLNITIYRWYGVFHKKCLKIGLHCSLPIVYIVLKIITITLSLLVKDKILFKNEIYTKTDTDWIRVCLVYTLPGLVLPKDDPKLFRKNIRFHYSKHYDNKVIIRKSLIEKLNSTQIYINKPYLDLLLFLFNYKQGVLVKRMLKLDAHTNVNESIYNYYYNILVALKDLPSPIYFHYTFDFRGRIYSNNPISQMSRKLFRPLFGVSPLDQISPYGPDFMDLLKWIEEKKITIEGEEDVFIKGLAIGEDIDVICRLIRIHLNTGLWQSELDCTASGFQHYSALTRDVEIGKKVGLFFDQNHQDLYLWVLDVTKVKWEEMYPGDPFIPGYDSKTLRSGIKKAVIGVIYGITDLKIKSILEESFGSLGLKLWPAFKEAKNTVLLGYFNKFRVALKSVIKDVCDWEFSDGYKVSNLYFTTHSFDTHFSHQGVTSKLKGDFKTFDNDLSKVLTRSLPNFIHRLDAHCLKLFILESPVGVLPIHDCGIVPFSQKEASLNLWVDVYKSIYEGKNIWNHLDYLHLKLKLEKFVDYSTPFQFDKSIMFKCKEF